MGSDPTEIKKRRNWGSFGLKTLFVLLTLATLFVAWRKHQYERGIVNRWVDAVLADVKANPLNPEDWILPPFSTVPCPVDVSTGEQIRLLLKGTTWLPDAERRTCVLKILAETFPGEAHDLFVRIAAKSKHTDLNRQAILLARLYRDENDLPQFTEYLTDENPIIRAAAVDAIGIICQPSFPIPAGFDRTDSQILFDSVPMIRLESLSALVAADQTSQNPFRHDARFFWNNKEDRALLPDTASRIREMMLTDPDACVRAAAARVMLIRPPDQDKLRVAEWGVWINDGGKLSLAQSIIDEIPPFVHRTGNSVAAIDDGRTNSMIIVTKPIIHITVDQPLVVDLSVRIAAGRPWFGFPMPDDFSVDGTTGQFGPVEHFPPDIPVELELENLDDVREGYPWIMPSHTKRYITTVTDIGFRWQSLIVLAQKAPWMSLEPVTDAKYEWWNRLREVPSSWVSSRGESERFLYYDGPTDRPSPVLARIDANMVTTSVFGRYYKNTPDERVLFYVAVVGGAASARYEYKDLVEGQGHASMPIHELPLVGDAAPQMLSKILVKQGLTKAEADGLVDCWRPQFFETDGRRLLTIFDKHEYDNLCPMTVSPAPTEFARVGIVLTEFGTDGR